MKRFFCLLILSLLFTSAFPQKKGIVLSHYLFPEFTQGTVKMKTGVAFKYLLNYNSLTEEMIFEADGKKLAISKSDLKQVDTVYIQNRIFFIQNNKFVELLYKSGTELYAEHKCTIKQPGKPGGYGSTSDVSSTDTYSTYNIGGIVYDLNLPEGYETIPHIFYWLKKDGTLNKFISLKQLIKLYDDKKDLIKKYIKEHNVRYEDTESIVELVEYMSTH